MMETVVLNGYLDPAVKNSSNLNAAQALLALARASGVQAPMAVITGEDQNLKREEAAWEQLRCNSYVDYLGGASVKINFRSFPRLDFALYVRDTRRDPNEIMDDFALENNLA